MTASTPPARSTILHPAHSVFLLVLLLSISCTTERGGWVSGSLFATGTVKTGAVPGLFSERIPLPDLHVYLFEMKTETKGPEIVTDLYGRYRFPRQKAGTYKLRWDEQNGWAAGSVPDKIVITKDDVFPISSEVQPKEGTLVVYGHTKMADGGSAYFLDELFEKVLSPSVEVKDAGTSALIGAPARVNAMGSWAVAGVPVRKSVSITLKSESAVANFSMALAALAGGQPADADIPDQRPQVISITPTTGAGAVHTAAPGSSITLNAVAVDADNDPIQFNWKLPDASGTITPTGSSVKWTLPAHEGDYSAYLLVSDGRGGYQMRRFVFSVGKTGERFSGRAVDDAGNKVPGAEVTVGGKSGTTNADGYFELEAPFADRYVMNLTKRGFALFSRVVDAGMTGQTWRMVRAQETSVDPTQDIVLVDQRKLLEREKRRGTVIKVPANSLVDGSGNKPSGNLNAYIATLNIANGEAPGDWGAINENGKETNLISYGATWVEFLDAAGTKYNLAPGKQAVVNAAAPDVMMPAAPANCKLWSYDEKDGYWKVSGKSNLLASKKAFEGKVSHFSTINTDEEKDNPACLRFLLFHGLPTGVKLRLEPAPGSTIAQTWEMVCHDGLNSVTRLPPNANIKLRLFDGDGTELGNMVAQEVVDATGAIGGNAPNNVINTGPAPGGNPFPPAPYEPCHMIYLSLQVGEFKQSDFLSTFKGIGTDDDAAAYYKVVDPRNERLTLDAWWDKNGFQFPGGDHNQIPTNATRTAYLNDNDLGSGRDMYFINDRTDGTMAAYVTNYGNFDQNIDNAHAAKDRRPPPSRGATVCMEYSPIEGAANSKKVVKFFVYNGANVQLKSANLDTYGEKFVPNLCNNCHGGSYTPPFNAEHPELPPTAEDTFRSVDMNSVFRELDVATYKFADADHQLAAFHQQNNFVKDPPANSDGSGINTTPIRELVTAWYSGGTDDQNNDYVPTGWSAPVPATLYSDVVKRSCRTCHVAFDNGVGSGSESWNSYDQLRGRRFRLPSLVLCQDRIMPHAVVTYRNFWQSVSPHSPGKLRDFTNPDWPPLGPCP